MTGSVYLSCNDEKEDNDSEDDDDLCVPFMHMAIHKLLE